jgi:hypothetical protein
MHNILQIQSVSYNENRRVVEAEIQLSVSLDSVAILAVYISMKGDKLYVDNSIGPYDMASLLQWCAWLAGHEGYVIESIKEALKKN